MLDLDVYSRETLAMLAPEPHSERAGPDYSPAPDRLSPAGHVLRQERLQLRPVK